MLRYVETGYRLRWIWPIVLLAWLALVATMLRGYRPQYETVTRVWVSDTAILLLRPDTASLTGILRTAPYQAYMLRELMSTDSFVTRVSANTALAQYVSTPEGLRAVRGYLIGNLQTESLGNNLFEIRFSADPPELGISLMHSTVAALRDLVAEADRSQASLVVESYGPELQRAERDLNEATAALLAFIERTEQLHGQAATSSVQLPLAIQVQLAELREREARARQVVDGLRIEIEKVQSQAAAKGTSWRASTAIIDAPAVSTQPKPAWQALGGRLAAVTVLPIIGLLLTLFFATWSDSSVHRPAEAAARFGLPVLGSLPRAQRSRRRAARPRATRPATQGV